MVLLGRRSALSFAFIQCGGARQDEGAAEHPLANVKVASVAANNLVDTLVVMLILASFLVRDFPNGPTAVSSIDRLAGLVGRRL